MSLANCCSAPRQMGSPVESAEGPGRSSPVLRSTIVGVGTATSEISYSQRDLLNYFDVKDRRIRSMFLNGSIERRYLTLPEALPDGTRRIETQGELLQKHKALGMALGTRALERCLERSGSRIGDVRYLC